MFKTIIVGLNLGLDGDRALPVVRGLARRSTTMTELVTVVPPGLREPSDDRELRERAASLGADRASVAVLEGDDPAAALVEHAARCEDPLLVLATAALAPAASSIFGSVTHDVLRRVEAPALLVGPSVVADEAVGASTLLACVDPSDLARRAAPSIVAWQSTFTSRSPHLVEVIPPGGDGQMARSRLTDLERDLAAQHVHAVVEVVHDDDLVTGLERTAERLDGPVYVTTSARYTDGRFHWHSSTQRLLRRATHPVLVVPARPLRIATRANAAFGTRRAPVPRFAAAPILS